MAKLEVYEKLWEAQESIQRGEPLIDFDEAMAGFNAKYGIVK